MVVSDSERTVQPGRGRSQLAAVLFVASPAEALAPWSFPVGTLVIGVGRLGERCTLWFYHTPWTLPGLLTSGSICLLLIL